MSADQRRTFLLAIVLLSAAFALKWWYRTARVDELAFLLRPVSVLVSGITGAAHVFEPDRGYLFPSIGIRIDRSCSGINFLVIAGATFALVILRRSDGGCARPLLAVLAATGAYLLAIVVNAGRIATMAMLQLHGIRLAPRAHEALGAFFFLGALLLVALALHRALGRSEGSLTRNTITAP